MLHKSSTNFCSSGVHMWKLVTMTAFSIVMLYSHPCSFNDPFIPCVFSCSSTYFGSRILIYMVCFNAFAVLGWNWKHIHRKLQSILWPSHFASSKVTLSYNKLLQLTSFLIRIAFKECKPMNLCLVPKRKKFEQTIRCPSTEYPLLHVLHFVA